LVFLHARLPERIKASFKSKEPGELRRKLEMLLTDPAGPGAVRTTERPNVTPTA
jgi:hypothetical protein